MKLLVIGSKGMLGSDLMEYLARSSHDPIGWDVGEIDITRAEEMSKILSLKPQWIINCAAYTNVDLAEKEKEKCTAVNVTGIENLVNACNILDCSLATISTDYVFDGENGPYSEDDVKCPINHYGLTKAQGEDIVRYNMSKYFIFRTSWLFGKKGKNFVDTISRLTDTKESIKVVNDQRGKPTYTRDLVDVMMRLIDGDSPHGVYHLTNSGECTWYEFALEIARIKESKCLVSSCSTAEFPRDAKRPRYSALMNNKTQPLRPWQSALRAYMQE